MERHWNVLKFTCGLMVDSSILIERICQAFVDIATRPKPRESFCSLYGSLYLKDLYQEKSERSLDPFCNRHLCYNSLISTECPLYYFNGWDVSWLEENAMYILEEMLSETSISRPCSVVIHQGLQVPLIYFLTICSGIRRPIQRLLIFGEKKTPSHLDYAAHKRRPTGLNSGQPKSAQSLLAFLSNLPKSKSLSAEPHEPSPPLRNKSQSAMAHISMGRKGSCQSQGALKLNHLRVAVFHKVNCLDCLTESLDKCKKLRHLTYIECKDPSFDTLEKNKKLKVLIVENCSLACRTQAQLYNKLMYLKNLEQISFKNVKYEKCVAKLTRKGVFSSLTSLKKLSLQDCELTTPTAVALMKCLTQCPLVELDISDNPLAGFICEVLHKFDNLAFIHLETMKCNNCKLLKTDRMALAELILVNKLPAIKAVFMKGNGFSNDKYFRRRNGHQIKVYMHIHDELKESHLKNEAHDHLKKDEMSYGNGSDDSDDESEEQNGDKTYGVKESDHKDGVKESDNKDGVKESDKNDGVKESDKKDGVKGSDKKVGVKKMGLRFKKRGLVLPKLSQSVDKELSDEMDEVQNSDKKDGVKQSHGSHDYF